MTTSDELVVFPVAIGDYRHHPPLDVDTEVARVVKLFVEFGGYEVPWAITTERGGDAVVERLQSWSNTSHGNTVLYWVGHGWSDTNTASLAHALSPKAVAEVGITPAALARRIAEREGAGDDGWAIIIVDACRSARFVELLNTAVDNHQGPRRLLLVGVSDEGATTLGRFTDVLQTVLRGTFRADSEIELSRLWEELWRNLPGGAVLPRNVQTAVLRRIVAPVATAATLDVVNEVKAVLARLSEDERQHFVPKAKSAELGEAFWYFEGRRAASTEIAEWLRTQSSGLLIVTGDAGSGKSALLGHLIVQSRPQLREILKRHDLAAERPADEQLPDDVFDTVLHLTGLTPSEVIRRLAADLGVGDMPAEAALRGQITWLCEVLGGEQRTILVDALDEAVTPLVVARLVLRPLAAVPGVRVVVGTRRSTRGGPDPTSRNNQDLLNALGQAVQTIEVGREDLAIERYVARRLTIAAERGKPQASHTTIETAAAAVRDAGQQFLFARLAVHEILAQPDLLTGSGLANLVTSDHRQLFTKAVARLSADRPVYEALLQALAYSRGRGLPICGGVWSVVASALSNQNGITDADAVELLDVAAPYVMLDREHGQTVYRLAHRTFAEHFTTESGIANEMSPEDRSQHHAIVSHLIRSARADPTAELNPYLTHYLSAHAGAAGEQTWHELASYPGVLDRLDPLTVGADAVRTAFGRFTLPPEIAGVVGARHLLAQATFHDRPGLRQLAMARHAGVTRADIGDGSDVAGWSVKWANIVGQPTHLTLTGHTGGVWAVCAVRSPDGRTLLATAGEDAMVRVWDLASGALVGEPLTGHTDWVRAMCPVPWPDGRTLLATASDDKTVLLWDPASGIQVGEPLTGHTRKVRAMCPVPWPDGRTRLATASDDATMLLWDPASGIQVGEPLTGDTRKVRAMCPVPWPDGRTRLATASDDATMRLWDPATPRWFGRRKPVTLTERTVVAVCAISEPGGTVRLAISSLDGTVQVWDPVAATKVGEPLTGHTSAVVAMCAVPEPGKSVRLASSSLDRTVRVWDPATSTKVGAPLTGHTSGVRALCAVPGSGRRTLVATVGDDATVRVWDPTIGIPVRGPLTGHTGGVRALCTVPRWPDGHTLLVTVGDDAAVHVWNPTTAEHVSGPLKGHTDWIGSVCPVPWPDGRTLLATGGDDAMVRVWDPVAATQVGEPLTGHTGSIGTMCVVAGVDGHALLATASEDATVRLWNPHTATQIGKPLTGHTGEVRAMCALPRPDGSVLLATASEDATVRLWNPHTATPIRIIQVGVKVDALCAITDDSLAIATAEGFAVLFVRLIGS
jgi:WD40 repeat protein